MAEAVRRFELPRDGTIFTDQIVERCESLINSGVWQGMDTLRLHTWIKNFRSDVERYFAACVLDALIFRSQPQTVALMNQLFQRIIPDTVRQDGAFDVRVDDWHEALTRAKHVDDPHIRIVPVLRGTDPPTKSGPLMCRLYRRHLNLDEAWMIWPWQIEEAKAINARVFLFVDDFLGTGDQFKTFARQFHVARNLRDAYGIYVPLVAHVKGIGELTKALPELRVCAVETLDERYNLFSDESMWFHDQINTPSIARRFHDDLVRERNLPIHESRRTGYGRLAIAYAFDHATPNNCLPILWVQSQNWNPLFER